MSKKQILAREQRWAIPAAIAPVAALTLLIVSIVVTQSNQPVVDNDPGFLRNYDESSSPLLIAAIIQGLSLLLLAVPFMNLFRATAARREGFRESLVGLTVAGPVFLAIGAVVVWAGFSEAADIFVDSFDSGPGAEGPGEPAGERAEDAVQDSSILVIGQGLSFAGALAAGIAMVYTGINSQRVGLLTRFWGTLGAALGVFIALAGLVGVLVYVLLQGLIGVAAYAWFVVSGMVAAGWWPGDRPPAWAAGEAIPWPPPGESRDQAQDSGGPAIDPEEPGLPADAEPESQEAQAAPSSSSRSRRRKRKRRG
jgi:hypothetical protein